MIQLLQHRMPRLIYRQTSEGSGVRSHPSVVGDDGQDGQISPSRQRIVFVIRARADNLDAGARVRGLPIGEQHGQFPTGERMQQHQRLQLLPQRLAQYEWLAHAERVTERPHAVARHQVGEAFGVGAVRHQRVIRLRTQCHRHRRRQRPRLAGPDRRRQALAVFAGEKPVGQAQHRQRDVRRRRLPRARLHLGVGKGCLAGRAPAHRHRRLINQLALHQRA
ncbi:MAG: hypothetical protein BWY76_02955 [bacterium ADurb.Bin429]|nr:MAG: hypothetical protein BWY76_02955 [bacterium ADurb.Bin429]